MADQVFLDSLTVRHIGPDIDVADFACASEGVCWFLRNVALDHHRKRISTTTCWMDGPKLAGYITIRNDEIVIKSSPRRQEHDLTSVKFTEGGKDALKFPSVLIGMLGVSNHCCLKGLGSEMIAFAIGHARKISDSASGCRFVRVDSERTEAALKTYRKAGFVSAPEQDEKRGTESMYFDLGPR